MDCDFITVDRWAGSEAMRLKSFVLYRVQVAHEVYDRDPAQDLFGSHSILCFMGWICLVLLSLWPSLFILERLEDGNSLCLSVEMKELSVAWHSVWNFSFWVGTAGFGHFLASCFGQILTSLNPFPCVWTGVIESPLSQECF